MIVFKKVKIKEFPGFIIMKKRLSFKNLLNKIYNFTLDGTLEHYGCYLPEKKGFFSNFILKMFFKRISIDEKQVEGLNELSENGIIVFASKYKSDFNYIFLNTRFRHEKLPFPEIGMDHNVFLFQPFRRKLKIVIAKFFHLLFKFKLANPYKSDFINNELLSGKNGFVSLICKKSFYGRFVKRDVDPLVNLIELQQKTDKTIYIVPKMMVYSLKPRRSKPSIVDVLFGRQENPGFIRRFTGILKSKKKVFVEIVKPFSLKDYLKENELKDNRKLAVKLRTLLIQDINKHRQILIGPVLKTRDEIKQDILTDENLEKFMNEHSQTENISLSEVHKKADRYIDEIASNYSVKWIDAYYFVLTWMFKNLFDGINIDYEGLNRTRELSKGTPLLIMPCHKSHLDYLIISYVMYANNMAPPQIAAGKNLSFWPLGTIFRGGGAFFIRRTFQGIPLYAKVFKAYVEKLIYEGFNIEFFIEGGRSRSGKLLSPKIGLLSIVLEAFLEGKCEDLNIVPIFIGYDRVLEEGAYLKEIEGGKKDDESVSQVFKARKFLKKRYGKVYVKFSDPIKLSEMIGDKTKDIEGEEKKEFFKDIGYTVINSINKEAVVTAFGIVAGAFLNSQRSSVTPEQLTLNVTTYYKYLKNSNVNFADTLEKDFDGSIKQAIETYESRGFVSVVREDGSKEKDSEKEIINYKIIDQKRLVLDYYKNNCLNHFIPGIYTAIAIIKNDSFDFITSDLTETYSFLQEFFIDEFSYEKGVDVNVLIRKNIKFFIDEAYIKPHEKEPDTYEITSDGFRKLNLYARFLKPYLESYKIVLKYLGKDKGKDTSKNRLKKIHSIGNKMIKSAEVERVESVSRINFKNGVNNFERLGIKDRDDILMIKEYKNILNSYIKIIN
jgi:glycerol-3-phosphate O-acyltransferase